MRRLCVVFLAAAALCGCREAPVRTPPPARPDDEQARRARPPVPQPPVRDAEVAEAIRKGAAYLKSAQLPQGHFPADGPDAIGPSLLAALALLETGAARADQPPMAKLLKWLGQRKLASVEHAALRCRVWAAARVADAKYRKPMRNDAVAVLKATWRDEELPAAVAGVEAAARANEEVPQQFWVLALRRLEASQNADGGWGAPGQASDARATTRALLALRLCGDNLFPGRFIQCGRSDRRPAVEAGRTWLDRHFRANLVGPAGAAERPAWLHDVARLGQAAGEPSFGGIDWARAGTAAVLRQQKADGSWPGRSPEAATARALRFLAEVRRPVLLLRLRYAGHWNNRPHAAGSLLRWLGRQRGMPWHGGAWRIVDAARPVDSWPGAQVLVVTGDQPISLDPAESNALRTFVHRGGTIVSLAEGNGQAFDASIRNLYARLWPDYRLAACPAQHELYSIHHRAPPPPALEVLSNGARPLAIHCREDLAKVWQLNQVHTHQQAFHLAENILLYVTNPYGLGAVDSGAYRLPRWPDPPEVQPQRTISLAHLRHGGNWDPEPLAYERFARLLLAETNVQLRVGPVDIAELAGSRPRIAHLTGTGPLRLSDGEQTALKQFVAAGGTLVVDAAGGDREFADSARELIRQLWGRRSLRRLGTKAAVYRLRGREIDRVRFRRRTRIRLGRTKQPNLYAATVGGRVAVFFSAEDLTAGLVGFPSHAVDGYAPESAYRLLRNIVLPGAP